MKKLLLMIAAAVLIAPLHAEARGWGSRFDPMLQGQGREMKKGPGQFQRGGRDARRDERPPRDERRQGRMTEEERRELHRDLDRANREIYRRGPPR